MEPSVDVDMTSAMSTSPELPSAPAVVAETLPSVELALPSEVIYALVCSWKGQKLDVTVVESDTVGDLKATLWSLTSVPPQRQKLVGLVKGKLPGDEAEVVSLGLGGGAPKQFMMVSWAGQEGRAPRPGSTTLTSRDPSRLVRQRARSTRRLVLLNSARRRSTSITRRRPRSIRLLKA